MPSGDMKGLGGDVGSLKPANIGSDGDLTAASGTVFHGANAIRFGTGAPSNAVGINGDIYIRIDGGALTTIYQRRASAYVGIV